MDYFKWNCLFSFKLVFGIDPDDLDNPNFFRNSSPGYNFFMYYSIAFSIDIALAIFAISNIYRVSDALHKILNYKMKFPKARQTEFRVYKFFGLLQATIYALKAAFNIWILKGYEVIITPQFYVQLNQNDQLDSCFLSFFNYNGPVNQSENAVPIYILLMFWVLLETVSFFVEFFFISVLTVKSDSARIEIEQIWVPCLIISLLRGFVLYLFIFVDKRVDFSSCYFNFKEPYLNTTETNNYFTSLGYLGSYPLMLTFFMPGVIKFWIFDIFFKIMLYSLKFIDKRNYNILYSSKTGKNNLDGWKMVKESYTDKVTALLSLMNELDNKKFLEEKDDLLLTSVSGRGNIYSAKKMIDDKITAFEAHQIEMETSYIIFYIIFYVLDFIKFAIIYEAVLAFDCLSHKNEVNLDGFTYDEDWTIILGVILNMLLLIFFQLLHSSVFVNSFFKVMLRKTNIKTGVKDEINVK